jgi:hypothetical protein
MNIIDNIENGIMLLRKQGMREEDMLILVSPDTMDKLIKGVSDVLGQKVLSLRKFKEIPIKVEYLLGREGVMIVDKYRYVDWIEPVRFYS